MGTNYYVTIDPCDKCGRSDQKLHIGKRSCGWSFHFQYHLLNDFEIRSYADYRKVFEQHHCTIADEDGYEMSPAEFDKIVRSAKGKNISYIVNNTPTTRDEHEYINRDRYSLKVWTDQTDKFWTDDEEFAFSVGDFS